MKAREVIGVVVLAIGVIVTPFGYWFRFSFYYFGFGFLVLGCIILFSGLRTKQRDAAGYPDPKAQGFPGVGEAREFHPAAIHEDARTSTAHVPA